MKPQTNVGLWIGLVVILVLVFAGIAMLIYAVQGILESDQPPVAVVSATAFVPVVSLPTQAPAADQPTQPSAAQPTEPPAATAVPSNALSITADANVRTGPGLNYPVIGGLLAGSSAELIGRDAGAQWYVINYGGGRGGGGERGGGGRAAGGPPITG